MLLTMISRSPSLSRSPTASPRPTAASCRPGPARSDTSRNRPPRFKNSWFFCRYVSPSCGNRIDVRKDVAVGEEQVEPAVEIGVEEGRAPAHANERRGRDARRARVFEVPAIDAAIQRVAIVRERRQHQIDPQVAIVVAGVGAHARLRAPVAVDRHAGLEADAFEAAVPEVVIQEVRVRVVGDEQVDEPVVVVIGGHDAVAVGARSIGEAVPVGRLHEAAVADVFEEQVGLPGKSRRPDHDARATAPAEGPLRPCDGVPRRLDVAHDVQVQIAVGVGIEERTARAPAAGGDPRRGSHVRERPVAAVAEQRVRPPVGHVEIEPAVAVGIAHARAAAPGRKIHARLFGDVLEGPPSEVPIQGVAMRDALTRRGELRRRHQVDVEQPIPVVVEQGDAAAGRFEDVILGGPPAMHLPRQLRTDVEGHRYGRAVVG